MRPQLTQGTTLAESKAHTVDPRSKLSVQMAQQTLVEVTSVQDRLEWEGLEDRASRYVTRGAKQGEKQPLPPPN